MMDKYQLSWALIEHTIISKDIIQYEIFEYIFGYNRIVTKHLNDGKSYESIYMGAILKKDIGLIEYMTRNRTDLIKDNHLIHLTIRGDCLDLIYLLYKRRNKELEYTNVLKYVENHSILQKLRLLCSLLYKYIPTIFS